MYPISNGRDWKLILLLPLLIQQSIAQLSWRWQNPLPQGDPIRHVQFLDSLHGWIVVPSNSILRTTDGGQTWQLHRLQKTLRRISFVSPLLGWAIGSDNYATIAVGIYKTTDGGITWQQQLADATGLTDDIVFTDANHGWALGAEFGFGTLWHTSDGGQTWLEQAGRQFVRGSGPGHLLSFRDSLTGWAGGWMFYTSKTTDGGQTWVRDSSLAGYNKFTFVDSLSSWASSTPESEHRRPIARSTDGGVTWVPTASQLIAEAHAISPLRCIAYTPQGVLETLDGGTTWITRSMRVFRSGTISSASRFWAFESNSFRFHESVDGGTTWGNRTQDAFQEGFTVLRAVDFVDSLHGWVVGQTFVSFPGNNLVARTINGGQTWERTIQGLPSEPLGVSFVTPLTGWIVGRSGTIRKTTDGGFNWEQQPSGTSFTLWDVQFLDTAVGYTAGSGTPGQNAGVILKTSNGGQTWIDQTPPGTLPLRSIQFVDENHGWASGLSVFLRTTDGGVSWINPLLDPTVSIERFFFVDRRKGSAFGPYSANPNHTSIMKTTNAGEVWIEQVRDSSARGLFGGRMAFADSLVGWIVGGDGAIWYTNDAGETWLDNSGVTSRVLSGLSLQGGQHAWLVGDQGMILHLRSDGTVGVTEEVFARPTVPLQVSMNYPNPFNSQTIIVYRVANGVEVSLELYDILGRLIRTIHEGYRAAGEHKVTINAEGLASGIYLYKLISGQRHQWGRIVLIR